MGVSLQDLIADGLLRPPLKLSRHYKGRDLDAMLHKDGTVEFQGKRYASCSTAATTARGTVIGGQPHTHGWKFWRFRGADGQLVALDQVRTGFIKARIVALERRA